MWTEEQRRTYRREGYPSDLRDTEAADPAGVAPDGRPRKTNMRAAMNAIFYWLRTGCPWRYPPRSTIYNIFSKFQRDGAWEAYLGRVAHGLRCPDAPLGGRTHLFLV